jgi:hypothetical protein
MSIKMNTQSELVHRTTVLDANALRDGGLQWLIDTFNSIHEEHSTGKLTVGFGQGSINTVWFEEFRRVTQKELDEWDKMRHQNGNGNHLAVRGAIRILDTL